MKKHNQDFMKKQNRLTVFEMIKTMYPISRAAIAKETGMSATTVGRIVGELVEEGYIYEAEQDASAGLGRKSTLLNVIDASVMTVGVEIDLRQIDIGIVDLRGNLVCGRAYPRQEDESAEQTIATMGEQIEKLIQEHKLERARIAGIGIGLPGIVEHEEGNVAFSVQLGWKNVRVAAMLKELTGLDTAVDNDLKVMALAEHLKGAAIGSRRTVLAGFGNGVGSALIVEGEIFRGDLNSAGEIGHTTVDPDGALCECGKAGCLQTYINIKSLLLEANKIRPVANMKELYQSWSDREGWAVHLMDRALKYMAITVNNLVCMYNPDSVIISGELVEQCPELYERLCELCATHYIWEPLRGSFQLARSNPGERSVVIGSGLLSQIRFFRLE